MESNEPQPAMYVCNPSLIEEGVGSYTSYTLLGTRVPEQLNRRYRDFDALRKKLRERWPGVFVPNIPHKKAVGNKDKEFIEYRIEMINRFCKRLSTIGYLFNSDEMELFLQNSSDVPKTLSNLKADTYEELLKKYSSVFTDYDENFDTQAGKTEQEAFYKQLIQNYPRIRDFRTSVTLARTRYNQILKDYLDVINFLSLYEKETVNNLVNNDENKLVFFNMKNIDLCKNISNAQEKTINPYDRLYDAVTEDYLATEAMQDSIESLQSLQDTYNKLTKSLTSTNVALNDLQAGKSGLKSMISFKSKEEDISSLMLEKEKLEKDLDNLSQVIKIATFNMSKEIQSFKTKSLENYYAELARLEEDTEKNAKIFDDLWETVCKDKNISEYN